MCVRGLLKATLMMALTLVFQGSDAYCRSKLSLQNSRLKTYKAISPETYNRVLDILFPRDEKAVFVIVLRFKPSSQPESQITIRKGLDKAEIIEYTSLSGNIYGKLDNVMAHGGREDAVEMAKLIKVRRRSIEVPYAQIEQWHTGFLDSIKESLKVFKEKVEEYDKGTSTIALDGTFYDLWYKQMSNEISFSLYDEETNDLRSTGEFKLVQWMNGVRQQVGKLK